MRPLFISGIGTGVGKTVVAAIITEALRADYWKPVQAGYESGTDSQFIASLIGNPVTIIHPEAYKLKLAASPHIAARDENQRIDIENIVEEFKKMDTNRPLVIEGAGGLMVPLNEKEFVIDLVKRLDVRLILVSRNYLGSINHSLMTTNICKSNGIIPAGWIFNDNYLNYESEIVDWSGCPALFSLPLMDSVTRQTISKASERIELSYLYSLL
jgi:dethiobiotin synthetase